MPTLNWLGKDKVINHHADVPYCVLDERYTYGDNADGNMIIKGDNLLALKSLLPKYEGRVKCIYIDPPYNTGNEGWVYNDNVNDPKIKKWLGEVVGKEGEDLSRHDKWLCMMYPRLRLLQRLLADDGAIFISIDDNEQANLRLICDEIFGNRNYISTIIRATGTHTGVGTLLIARETDSIISYAKRIENIDTLGIALDDEDSKKYNLQDEHGRFLIRTLRRTGGENRREDRPNMYYPLTAPDGTVLFPIGPTGYESRWICIENTYWEFVKQNRILWKKNEKDGKWQVFQKFYLENRTKTISNLWSDIEGNKKATRDVRAILGDDTKFDYPKPISLIERILQITTSPGDIVLDSFAGSGTTAHAALNTGRKFILVEMEDYAENITAERVKRVIDGYADKEGTGGGFGFYELGERLLLENGNLNENVGEDRIYEYIWYTETRTAYEKQDTQYLLGIDNNTAYYFNYEKDKPTSLDLDFLKLIKTKAERYLVYADTCMLSQKDLTMFNITFKKIPRDIKKF